VSTKPWSPTPSRSHRDRDLRSARLRADAAAERLSVADAYAARQRAIAVLNDPSMSSEHEIARAVMRRPEIAALPPLSGE
jgi:hypothetical protein